jgi:CRP-like cAMP-binding protein
VGQLANQSLLQVGAWQISRLRRQPLLEFYPWKPPESITEATSERKRVNRDPLALAHFYQSLLDSQVVSTRAQLARYLNVSRARVTQVLRRLKKSSHLPSDDGTAPTAFDKKPADS